MVRLLNHYDTRGSIAGWRTRDNGAATLIHEKT